ncbi:nuclear transcription factor Y subunit gamma isoform X1 [Photinus pyralis]|uniref:Nuclear transcription factor Y subunit gamma n=2 Tax=Photinus pyralis TaxID=7054 RepID=A0A1Y1KDJ2_PHOPY|nr:nuclear transcription factor Y subunit gamma isoform X1 [Photinus pyralis]
MSVFFVNASGDNVEVDQKSDLQQTVSDDQISSQSEAQAALQQFWPRVMEEIKAIATMDLRQQVLPLARIKKIMKLDDEVKMISAEAPLLFAKAAEIFIHELTLRAWVHTEDNKRRTLQRNDIAMAITKFDQFDFLIDIVPRDDIKPNKPRDESGRPAVNSEQVHYYLQLAQQAQQQLQQLQPSTSPSASTTNSSVTQNAIQIVQPQVQAVPVNALEQNNTSVAATTTTSTAQPSVVIQNPTSPQSSNGNIHIVQQIVTPGGEIQQIPIQLTPQQLQMIRMQLQSNTNQPLIIQAAPIQTIQPQVIQVTQQNSNAQPVYLTENNGNTESE